MDNTVDFTSVGGEVKHYEFNEDFQKKIVALCVRDSHFLQLTEGLIKPEYFEQTKDSILANIALKYYSKYKKAPTDISVLKELIRADVANRTIPKEYVKEIVDYINPQIEGSLFQHDISDRDYVVEEIAVFARHQAVSDAILKSVDFVGKKDFSKVQKLLTEALDVGKNDMGGVYDYAQMIDARTEKRKNLLSGKERPSGITTGFEQLDNCLYQKGWGRKELSLIMAPLKGGKSMSMLDFSLGAISSRHLYNVLYVTLEVSSEIISDRLDARIASLTMMDARKRPVEVLEKVRNHMKMSGRFIIHEAPTGEMTPSDLRRLIERYKARGLTFDLIVVDYADLMRPDVYTHDTIENSKQIYVGLRAIAVKENVAVLTATQTNREGMKKEVSTAIDISDDINKGRIADVLITINRTEEERMLNQARLYFAASRNQASGFSIRISQDLSKMKFIDEILGVE